MKMSKSEYLKYVDKKTPPSPVYGNMMKAFISGGIICCIGQLIKSGYLSAGLDESAAGAATSVSLIFIGAMLTGLNVYNRLAKLSGAGTLVPITGFANSVASAAIEFKSEGLVAGTSAKMFVIAGPVIVFGISASVIYGIIYCLVT